MAAKRARMRAPALSLALALLAAAAAPAQNRLGDLQSEFDQQKDPVRKAKLLPRLGDAQLEMLRQHASSQNYAQALLFLQSYRDAVQSAYAGLKSSGLSAEKKPSGFKHLEIHLRKSIRSLNDTILAIPFTEREPFESIRRELEAIDKELIDLLFPRQPGRHRKREKPKR